MSNLLNYLTIGKKLGEPVALPYNGDSFTSSVDGSVWKMNNLKVFPYTSDYAQFLAECPTLVTSAVQFPGDLSNGAWDLSNSGMIAVVGSSTWLAVTADTTYYLTSADSGATWTKRAYPIAAKTWTPLWDGTNFVIYANGSTTNGVYESTDGISWTTRTAISITTMQDLVYNGTVYLAFPRSGTTAATSTDRTTWTTRTLFSSSSNQTFRPGLGTVTWNAGAGLFIAGTQTGYTYQTSPDGVTWSSGTFPNYFNQSVNTVFSSNATTTVAITTSGKCITTTDGINWTQRTIDSEFTNLGSMVPPFLYFDGTRFVTSFYGTLYYSTDGTTWTKSTKANLTTIASSSVFRTPTGIGNFNSGGTSQYALHISDPTSVATTNIIGTTASTLSGATATYIRIK